MKDLDIAAVLEPPRQQHHCHWGGSKKERGFEININVMKKKRNRPVGEQSRIRSRANINSFITSCFFLARLFRTAFYCWWIKLPNCITHSLMYTHPIPQKVRNPLFRLHLLPFLLAAFFLVSSFPFSSLFFYSYFIILCACLLSQWVGKVVCVQ